MRILLTRTWLQARQSAEVLAAHGFRPVIEPMTRIEPLPWSPAVIGRGARVVVTSPNGARELVRCGRPLDDVPLFAVGEASAGPLRAAGLSLAGVANGTAADLLTVVRSRLRPEDGPIVHVGGEEIAVDLAGALREAGYDARRVVAYRVRTVRAAGRRILALLEAGRLDGVLFLSRRSAEVFAALVTRNRALPLCRHLDAVAVSERIAGAVWHLPWRTVRTADHPEHAALLETLRIIRTERAARIP